MKPLYQEIFLALKQDILSGLYPPESQLPTEKELAETYHVSRITSKRALTELEQENLIYRIQGKGSFVKTPEKVPVASYGASRKILFILPFAHDLSLGNFNIGLEPVLQKAGYTLFMTTFDFLQNKNLQTLKAEFAGLIYYAESAEEHLDLLFELQTENFPCVILDKVLHELQLPAVISDNFSGGYLQTEALLKAGHKKIAYLFSGKKHPQTTRNRYLGYLEALRQAKNDFHTPLNLALPFSEVASYLLKEGITGVVLENDLLTISLMRELKKVGFAIPKDFSLVGFDDIQAASLVDPAISTIAQDFNQLGKVAGTILLKRLAGKEVPMLSKIPVSFVSRHSIAPLKK